MGTRLRRLAACVHSAAFMQRYRSDLDTREARRTELARRWYACLLQHNLLMRSLKDACLQAVFGCQHRESKAG